MQITVCQLKTPGEVALKAWLSADKIMKGHLWNLHLTDTQTDSSLRLQAASQKCCDESAEKLAMNQFSIWTHTHTQAQCFRACYLRALNGPLWFICSIHLVTSSLPDGADSCFLFSSSVFQYDLLLGYLITTDLSAPGKKHIFKLKTNWIQRLAMCEKCNGKEADVLFFRCEPNNKLMEVEASFSASPPWGGRTRFIVKCI